MDRDENIEHEFQDDIFVIVKHIVQDITGKKSRLPYMVSCQFLW